MASSLYKDSKESLRNRTDNICALVSGLTNGNRFAIEKSLEAASVDIWSLDDPRYVCIPDSAKPYIKKCRDIITRKKDSADANRVESNTFDALREAYSSSSRDIDSDCELCTSIIRFKIEFEDFMKDTNIRDLLASCRSINNILSSKRFIGEFDLKTMKVPNFVLVNTDE